MGSEDLFHKRKARKAEDSVRKKSKRQSYDRVLSLYVSSRKPRHQAL